MKANELLFIRTWLCNVHELFDVGSSLAVGAKHLRDSTLTIQMSFRLVGATPCLLSSAPDATIRWSS